MSLTPGDPEVVAAALPAIDVLVIGDVMLDIIVAPTGPLVRGSDRTATIRTRPGGSGANQAVWLADDGIAVALAARVGADDLLSYERHFLSRGVFPVLGADPERASGVLVTLLDPNGERSFLSDRGANLALSHADLPARLLDGVKLLLVSGYSLFAPGPRSAVIDCIARARACGIRTAIDPGSAGFLAEVGPARFLEWTRGADLVFANRDEARLLANTEDTEEQVRRLGQDFGTVLVKLGAEGAVLGGRLGIRHGLGAPQVVVVDTTGAGDAFAAGFIQALLDGEDEAHCLSRAVAAGSSAVGRLGGQPG